MSDIEGKVAREAMSECGQRASFKAFGVYALTLHLPCRAVASCEGGFLLPPSYFLRFLLFSPLLIGEIWGKIAHVSTVQEISQAIEHLNVRDQIRLLHDLPTHLKIQPDDVAWLKVAEPAFEFWNNPEDAIYDEL